MKVFSTPGNLIKWIMTNMVLADNEFVAFKKTVEGKNNCRLRDKPSNLGSTSDFAQITQRRIIRKGHLIQRQ
jgi:hypothetical protein